jgi:hypothetical protein
VVLNQLEETELPHLLSVGGKLLRASFFYSDTSRASCTHSRDSGIAPGIDCGLVGLGRDWLDSVEETKASKWFYETWTGEHGNDTNASAENVGTANANGTVSCCRYLKRNTIGQAGTNVCMPLAVFVQSIKTHETDFSIRHADGILCEETGKHFSPSKPITTPAFWKKVQDMVVRCLMFAYDENSQASRTLWDRAMDAISESGMGEQKTSVT